MFVVCAQAPGRIDGVLVVLVVEVLITSHSACPLMRAAQGACPIGMWLGGLDISATALRRHRKKSWRSPLDRWRRAAGTAWTFPERRGPMSARCEGAKIRAIHAQ